MSRKKRIKVLCCASEVAPFAKTGGLADVTGSLPPALARHNVETLIVMPRYRGISQTHKKITENVTVYFVTNEEYFNRSELYGGEKGDYPDNLQRFSFYCHEALAYAKRLGFQPDVLHAHDWQAALLPVLLKTKYKDDNFFAKTRSVFTIHNIAYQGLFPYKQYTQLGLDPTLFSVDGFEFYGKVSLMKAGLLFADLVTTVSPTYAEEIKTKQFAFGLEGVIKKREKALRGILNGIDVGLWDPSKDTRIPKAFTSASMEGKKACKEALQKHCGLEVNAEIPLFGMVTRLASQKGLELVAGIMDALVKRPAQFVLLGDGDAIYKTTFRNLCAKHPKQIATFLTFDAIRAHAIYAGSDFFLMPSHFEPCGLGQMIAMRYGALPVVRRVGGLADTVIDAELHPEKGDGFVFVDPTSDKLMTACQHALKAFKDKEHLAKLRKNAMKKDFSWDASAEEYVKLYNDAMKLKAAA